MTLTYEFHDKGDLKYSTGHEKAEFQAVFATNKTPITICMISAYRTEAFIPLFMDIDQIDPLAFTPGLCISPTINTNTGRSCSVSRAETLVAKIIRWIFSLCCCHIKIHDAFVCHHDIYLKMCLLYSKRIV